MPFSAFVLPSMALTSLGAPVLPQTSGCAMSPGPNRETPLALGKPDDGRLRSASGAGPRQPLRLRPPLPGAAGGRHPPARTMAHTVSDKGIAFPVAFPHCAPRLLSLVAHLVAQWQPTTWSPCSAFTRSGRAGVLRARPDTSLVHQERCSFLSLAARTPGSATDSADGPRPRRPWLEMSRGASESWDVVLRTNEAHVVPFAARLPLGRGASLLVRREPVLGLRRLHPGHGSAFRLPRIDRTRVTDYIDRGSSVVRLCGGDFLIRHGVAPLGQYLGGGQRLRCTGWLDDAWCRSSLRRRSCGRICDRSAQRRFECAAFFDAGEHERFCLFAGPDRCPVFGAYLLCLAPLAGRFPQVGRVLVLAGDEPLALVACNPETAAAP